MKTRNIIRYAAVAVAGLTFATACNDAEYDTISNGLFFNETLTGDQSIKYKVEEEGLKVTLAPRMGERINHDVKATISIDEALLATYNQQNATAYEILPAEYLNFDADVLFKTGKVSPEKEPEIAVSSFDTPNGEMYAIPVVLSSNDGVKSAAATSKYIILLDKPLIQAVPQLDYSQVPTSPAQKNSDGGFDQPWGYQSSEWSIEFWLNMDSFRINNQAIVNVSATSNGNGHEIYARFGDAGKDYNMLQMKTAGSQVDSKARFEANKWYHIAYTFTSSGLLTLYVNGEQDVTLQVPAAGTITFNGIELCSSGTYFLANCQMAQLRFWNKALSQTQIKSNMNYSVKGSDESLMGYWKMDDGEGSTFKDYSTHGKDMVLKAYPTWIPDIHF